MKIRIAITAAIALSTTVGAVAQDERAPIVNGNVTVSAEKVELDTSSAKFTEYRDIRDGVNLSRLNVEILNEGLFLDLDGKNLFRDDYNVRAEFGDNDVWNVEARLNGIPHNISDNARTVFFSNGNGRFVVPSNVGLRAEDTTRGIPAVGTPSLVPTVAQMAANDLLIGEFVKNNLQAVDLGTMRDRRYASISLNPMSELGVRLSYLDEFKVGNKSTNGAIGDRPPRTMNVELAEPIDYRTRELEVAADVTLAGVQGEVSYRLSDFDNEIEAMEWQNIFFAATNGDHTRTVVEADGSIRRVSASGRRSLAPDNQHHNVMARLGIDLPLDSRLMINAAYGWGSQDQTLLPYSTLSLVETSTTTNPSQLAWNDLARLPRLTAEAEIQTMVVNVDYAIRPLAALGLRAFFRMNDATNNTTSSQWRYVTQDVTSNTGGVNYRNHVINHAFATDRMNFGLDADYRLPLWQSTIGVGFEQEGITRKYREVGKTQENIVRASIETRPISEVRLRAKYLLGMRTGDEYDSQVTEDALWYTVDQSPATGDRDNPKFAFANHPDLRKYDVSDRLRNQIDAMLTVRPADAFTVGASFNLRSDDFDSDVTPTQPLLNFNDNPIDSLDRIRFTVGQQLGLLKNSQQSIGLNLGYEIDEDLSLSAFASRMVITSDIRGVLFNENRRENPGTIDSAITNLGRWSDARYQYNGTIDDATNTIGVGASYQLIPETLRIYTDNSYSQGTVDFAYSGYGTDFSQAATPTNWETFQFGFRSPEQVAITDYTMSLGVEYQVIDGLMVNLQYFYNGYSIDDWLAEAEGPWVEEVGSEYFLRDTSKDNRWGNRLVNLGTDRAPDYTAHFGRVSLTYGF